MPKIITPLCENLFSWAFHVFIICILMATCPPVDGQGIFA
jgi:hypothetical protein